MPRLNGIPASPRARRLARIGGPPTTEIFGTGPNGRILEADVKNAATRLSSISPMRRSIAQRTTETSSVPCFHLRAEIDVTAFLEFRESTLQDVEAVAGGRLTITDILLKSIAAALISFPKCNSVWRDRTIETIPEANVGLVVSLSEGLLIPVARLVDTLDLPSLVRQRRVLVDSARSMRLNAEQTRGASASLSNLGATRVDEFTAILAPNQTTMLAVGRIAQRPFVVNGGLAVRSTAKLSLTVDHRVLDGESAARYLGAIMDGIENPASLF